MNNCDDAIRQYYRYKIKELNKKEKNKVPIYKKCPNQGQPCFCDGTCREIIGYRDKHPLE